MVIAIIAILAAMLLPALTSAKQKALRTQCFNNQRQIGMGYTMYADEANGFYPVQDGWGAGGGQLSTNADTSGNAANYGGQVPENKRPLNRYVPNVNTFHCPCDKGDPLNSPAKSCWVGWGNSYLVEWNGVFARVQTVTGAAGNYSFSQPASPSIKASVIGMHPANKLIQGDWCWHYNRVMTDPRTWWHTSANNRADAVLFGDNHVQFFKFPSDAMMGDGLAPDPNYSYW